MKILEQIKHRIMLSNNITKTELNNIINADSSVLLNPKTLYDVDKLVDKLYEIKELQKTNPKELVVIDTDYDTDGILSACVLSASLGLFGINHRIYIPTMHNGYGLSKIAIDEMIYRFENNDYKINTILTADNGTNANEAVSYAKDKGYTVLITDHHLGSDDYPIADALVNPNTPRDEYTYKGNAGATVAWKVMLHYCHKYTPENYEHLMDLIVFAGMANLSDVMPMTEENHYMTKQATKILNKLRNSMSPNMYHKYDCPKYNNIIDALFEFVHNIQNIRNKEKGKESPYPTNEEFISWYISPMLNAPRRVKGTPEVAFKVFLHHDKDVRYENTKILYNLNLEKTKLADKAFNQITKKALSPNSNTVLVETTHGIVGLVASRLVNQTNNPSFVFVDSGRGTYVSSARSSSTPLPLIINYVIEKDPDIIVSGGGHDNAGGYEIIKEKFVKFRELVDEAVVNVNSLIEREYNEKIKSGEIIPLPLNTCQFSLNDESESFEYTNININQLNKQDIIDILQFLDSLRPFGRDFNVKPEFTLKVKMGDLKDLSYNPNFWKTFKTEINNIQVLTFNIPLADKVKNSDNDDEILECKLKFDLNHFRGSITPQIILE